MTDTSLSLRPDFVLAHADWVRNLAGKLVQDPHLAEDLAQSTCMTAMLRPPQSRGNLRNWLFTILRNSQRQDARRESKRRQIESGAARPEALPSAEELVTRAQEHGRVVEGVLSLAEPYRSTVLLRYFEDLPPRRIAERQKVSVNTVNTRLARAHALLRKRLQGMHADDRRAYLAALLPIARPRSVGFSLSIGAAFMKTKNAIFASIALAASIAIAWPFVMGESPADASGTNPLPVEMEGVALETETQTIAERSAVEIPVVTAVDSPAATEARPLLQGLALDLNAAPVAELSIFSEGALGTQLAEDEQSQAESDLSGQFHIPLPEGPRRLRAEKAGLTTLFFPRIGPNDLENGLEPILVVVPSVSLAGQVHDEQGRPLPSASVSISLPQDLRTRFSRVLEHSSTATWAVKTESSGQFELTDAGYVAGSTLRITLQGFLPFSQELSANSDMAIAVTLRKPSAVDGAIVGQVVDAAGNPVADAKVSLGSAESRSDAEGRFQLALADAGKADEMQAIKRGYLPASKQLDREQEGNAEFVYLSMGDEPLHIRGRVLDANGEPIAGAKVWAQNPGVVSSLDGRMASMEGYLNGGLTRQEMRDKFFRNGELIGDPVELRENTSTAIWGWAKTDENGDYDLGGLLDKPYGLTAILPESLVQVDAGPFQAGMVGADILVPAAAVHPLVAGQLVSRNGSPIPNANISAQCDPMSLGTSGGSRTTVHASGRNAVSDENGRFRIKNLGTSRVYLRIDGDSVLPIEYGRGHEEGITAVADQPIDNLRIVVPVRIHFRVELSDANLADQICALDAEGKRLGINQITPNGRTTRRAFDLQGGQSEVLSVSDAVSSFALLKGDETLRTIPFSPRYGEVNVIRN